jgi:hypothetical protein
VANSLTVGTYRCSRHRLEVRHENGTDVVAWTQNCAGYIWPRIPGIPHSSIHLGVLKGLSELGWLKRGYLRPAMGMTVRVNGTP